MAKEKKRTGDRHVGVAKTFRFTEEQLERLQAYKGRSGGTYADAIDAAVRIALGKNELTAEDIIAWVRSRA